MKRLWNLADSAATERLGVALAQGCPWSTREARVLYLSGEIGAGKTTLVAALLAALGVEETVRSPSYALLETYAFAVGTAVHLDLYRLLGVEELEPLGLRDYLHANTLLLIEWPERAQAGLPRADLELTLRPEQWQQALGRECCIEARTAAGEAWLAVTTRAMPSQI